jgi:hypothetical protein
VLVVEVDGSMLPIRGDEPWKEANVGVVYPSPGGRILRKRETATREG